MDIDAVGIGHPDRAPLVASIAEISRTVVVLPLVPVTATSGMRPFSWGSNIEAIIASPTARPLPKDGCRCPPGAAFYFDDTAALDLERFEHGFRRRRRPRRYPGQSCVPRRWPDLRVGMDLVGDVGCGAAGAQVGIVPQRHTGAHWRY